MTTRGSDSSRRQPSTHATPPPPPASTDQSGVDLKQLKDELTCSICLEICIRPCSTPCGHSFCRRCLREALRHSPKCPKCRDVLGPGFSLTVNVVLWNTIRMLFPKTEQAPASPPGSPTPIRQATDGRHLRRILNLEAEARRRLGITRVHRDRISALNTSSRNQMGDPQISHRRRRMSPSTQDHDGIEEGTTYVASGLPTFTTPSRARRIAEGVGGQSSYLRSGQDVHTSSRHGASESPEFLYDHQHDSFGSNIDYASIASSIVREATTTAATTTSTIPTTNDSFAREDNHVHDMLSSSRPSWIRRQNGSARRGLSGIHNGHGFDIVNSLNRSASHGDLHHHHHHHSNSDVEYVTIQRVQRADQVPSHRRRGVFRLEAYNRDRVLQQLRRNRDHQYLSRLESAPETNDRDVSSTADIVVVEGTTDFDEEDFETASDIVSDRDSSFSSSIAAVPFPGSHVNSFRFHHEDIATSPAENHDNNPASATASIAGDDRLYDISSQIQAAMNDIVRLNLHADWSRHVDGASSQPPATPLTHRSCFQLSDDEEEEVDWNTQIRDAVFILDNDDDEDEEEETESESDAAASLPISPFADIDDQSMYRMTEPQWISSVEDHYSYY